MAAEPQTQEVNRPRFSFIEVLLVGLLLFFIFRFTAVGVLFVLAVLYIFFPVHRSRRIILVSYALFFAAVLVPVDVYIPGLHGRIHGDKHNGPRLVRVVYGKPMIQRSLDKYGEFVCGGCVGGFHDPGWRFVWIWDW